MSPLTDLTIAEVRDGLRAKAFSARELTVQAAAQAPRQSAGPARDVLHVGDVPLQAPGSGEVRVRLATSGVNPSAYW